RSPSTDGETFSRPPLVVAESDRLSPLSIRPPQLTEKTASRPAIQKIQPLKNTASVLTQFPLAIEAEDRIVSRAVTCAGSILALESVMFTARTQIGNHCGTTFLCWWSMTNPPPRIPGLSFPTKATTDARAGDIIFVITDHGCARAAHNTLFILLRTRFRTKVILRLYTLTEKPLR